ncbi:MAG TPA: DUF1028 domain-containing protein [Glaciihabitans sp.]|jgi:uncharacterized Ntn-hydrolase superfamily protein|nr:DUF1028 domain-containing protein [Glaciihabitans sp.]
MTFSLAARDPATGAFGMVISSSSPAVASRCVNLRASVGVAASQNVTNPALGPFMLDKLAAGASADGAIAAAVALDEYSDFRQLTIVDAEGRVGTHTGSRALGIFGVSVGDQAVAAGNMLFGLNVLDAMVSGYAESAAETFEERLLAGFLSAVEAGGEAGPVRSAGLSVVEDVTWRVTDLRVDDSDDPAAELARLLSLWLPQKKDYLGRALRPGGAPSYGVPGDV